VGPSICYVATYDPDYSRNLDVIRSLKSAGVRVEVVRGVNRTDSGDIGKFRLRVIGAAMTQCAGAIVRVVDVSLRLLRCRVLVVGYLGQFDMLTLGLVARCLGRPVIFNPLVTLTDTIVEDRRLLAKNSPVAFLIRVLDRISLRLADLVIVDTAQNAEYVTNIASLKASQLLVLPVGADQDVFYPSTAVDPRTAGCLDVLFYGKFIPLHGVETIVRAAALLQSTHPGIRFELIGSGQDYTAARELARNLEISNVLWTDWLPYSELGKRLRKADIALGIFDSGEKAARVIPNKVHQALACGVPVVTRNSPAISDLLTDQQSALLVPPEDPAALAGAIVELAEDDHLRIAIGAAGRIAWEAHASEDRLAVLAQEALQRVGVIA
jgi:glycosyltransferase involved in cell wall biosynthesis